MASTAAKLQVGGERMAASHVLMVLCASAGLTVSVVPRLIPLVYITSDCM